MPCFDPCGISSPPLYIYLTPPLVFPTPSIRPSLPLFPFPSLFLSYSLTLGGREAENKREKNHIEQVVMCCLRRTIWQSEIE